MAHIHETIAVEVDPQQVWEIAGDPGQIADWVPALSSSREEAGHRHCTMTNGAELEERILGHSDDERSYEYEIVEAPMPIRSYWSRLSVHGHDGHSHIDWQAEFEPEQPEQEAELVDAFTRTYREGLESLRRRLES